MLIVSDNLRTMDILNTEPSSIFPPFLLEDDVLEVPSFDIF